MRFDAIIFDFDGVLIDGEHQINRLIAELLTEFGHPMTPQEVTKHFTGLSGQQFIDTVERTIEGALPGDFHPRLRAAGAKAMREGIPEVIGAVDFVRALNPNLPKAVASSSSTHWIRTHLAHLGLEDVFGSHIYSGKEHVDRGKPAPDLYLHAADALGVPIERCVIIEDSKIGATGAFASGATVIGLAAGTHCMDGHAEMLRSVGVQHVAHSFDEVARLVGLQESK